MDANYEIKAAKHILEVWMRVKTPPTEANPLPLDARTIGAAFGVVDHDHDKVHCFEKFLLTVSLK